MADLAQNFGQADIGEITSDTPRSQFSEAKIEQLANLILQGGGVVRPLVLRQTGIDSYTVLDGHLEYHAAVRAREIDARRGEMVNAFIIPKDDEDAILKQIANLSEEIHFQKKTIDPSSDSLPPPSSLQQASAFEPKLINYEARLNNTETRLNNFQNDQRKALQNIEHRLQAIESEKEQKTLLEKLNESNKEELEYLFSRYSVAYEKKCARLAQLVHEARENQEDKMFKSYLDLVKLTRGFTENSMLKLMNNWELYR